MPKPKTAGKTPVKRRSKAVSGSNLFEVGETPSLAARMDSNPAKTAAFEAFKLAVNHKHGSGSIMDVTADSSQVSRIAFRNPEVDRILGGGLPLGRIIEVYGPESSGKTTLALHALAAVQYANQGGNAAFVDVEHALDPKYAEELGVDLSRCGISQPDTGEQALDIVEMAVKSGAVDVVVLDSVASLTPKAELEGSMEDQQVGLQSRLMGKAMRKLTAAVAKSKCIVIFINQIRDKVGVMGYGEQTTTPGGRALKFYASIRLDVRRLDAIKKGEVIIGQRVTVNCKKNKVAPPFKKCTVDLFYPNAGGKPGFCPFTALLDRGVEAGVISKNGGTYKYNGNAIGASRMKAREALSDNVTLYDHILQEIERG